MDHHKNTSLAYDPDYLTTNFFEERCQREHKQRLRDMKPYIDSRTNKTMNMPHLRSRLKKRMMERHNRDRVEHENRLLLNRLSHIMRTKQVRVHTAPRRVARSPWWRAVVCRFAAPYGTHARVRDL